MIRHLVIFRWNDGVTDEQVAALAAGLAALPGQVGTMLDYRFGPDIGENEASADYGVIADFATIDDYRSYRDHPDHRSVVADLVLPICAERTSVQLELDG